MRLLLHITDPFRTAPPFRGRNWWGLVWVVVAVVQGFSSTKGSTDSHRRRNTALPVYSVYCAPLETTARCAARALLVPGCCLFFGVKNGYFRAFVRSFLQRYRITRTTVLTILHKPDRSYQIPISWYRSSGAGIWIDTRYLIHINYLQVLRNGGCRPGSVRQDSSCDPCRLLLDAIRLFLYTMA